MDYYVLGYLAGVGRKKRAAQTDIAHDLRSLAFFGLCNSEYKQSHLDAAVGYCQKSLAYDKTDPYTHYLLGLCYARLAQANGNLEILSAAAKHFRAMLDLNGDLEEAQYARANLKQIDKLLAAR
jgi:hypothetical protein